MGSVTFVNHASVLIEDGGIGLLSDPWFEGSAFDDGWDLLLPMPDLPSILARVTHVWISHEHPDHFSPKTLQTWFSPYRKTIQFLYKKTHDRRVVNFLRDNQFECIELPDGTMHSLASQVSILSKTVGTEDSLLVFKGPSGIIVNTNDAIVLPSDMRYLREFVVPEGRVNVMLTQFSLAGKCGNTSDVLLRESQSQVIRANAITQALLVGADTLLPFASMKFFSHEANHYMNQGNSRAELLLDESLARNQHLTFMLPGESMSFNQKWPLDSSRSRASEYDNKLQSSEPLHTFESSIPLEVLITESQKWSTTTRMFHSRLALLLLSVLPSKFRLKTMHVTIDDLNLMVHLGNSGIDSCSCSTRAKPKSLSIHSTDLLRIFTVPYGGMTLMINARLQASDEDLRSFRLFAQLGTMRAAGIRMNLPWLLSNLIRIREFAR